MKNPLISRGLGDYPISPLVVYPALPMGGSRQSVGQVVILLTPRYSPRFGVSTALGRGKMRFEFWGFYPLIVWA